MSEAQIQCPVCGEMQGVTPEDRYTVCHYCEAKLALHRGRAGKPVASVDAADAENILFEQTGYNELWNLLQNLLGQREALGSERDRELAAGTSRLDVTLTWVVVVVCVGLLIVAALLENRTLAFWAGISLVVGRVAALVVRQFIERRLQTVRVAYEPRLDHLTAEIDATQRRLQVVREEIDRMTPGGGRR
ncbi:MAG: hypothetical protein ACYC5O_18590 [Anaerolineae bacterium]